MLIKIIYFAFLYIFTEFALCQESTLKFVQVLFRHGDRTPTDLYKNDPNTIWSEGLGQLTNKGKEQMYELGLRLREEYKDFLSQYYFPEDVVMLSSEKLRNRMSAASVLAGLYPPVKEQIWNKNLLWQPIPINYIPRSSDNLIAMKKHCALFARKFEEALNSEKVKFLCDKYNGLFEYLSQNSGDSIDTLGKVETLYNTLTIEMENKRELPDWVKNLTATDLETMRTLAAENLALYSSTPVLRRLQGGPLLKEITSKMVGKRENNLKPNLSLLLYSGHDLTIVSLMQTMGFRKLLKPDYGATIIFELHQIDDEYEVRFLYRQNYSASLEQENIEFCYTPCSLNAFVREAELLYPADWEQECADL